MSVPITTSPPDDDRRAPLPSALAKHDVERVPLRFFGSPRPLEPVAWLVAVVGFALLAAWAVDGAADGVDRAALEWLQRPKSPELDMVAHVLSVLGSEAIGIVHLLLLGVLIKRRRWELAIGLFVATAGAGFLNGVVKDFFDRERPAEVYGLLPATAGQVYSFPSGHAMVTAAFFYFLAYVSCPFLTGWRRSGWVGLLLTIAVVVGLARTYLGAHWLTDVLAGYLIGYVWAQSVIFGAHLIAKRRGAPAGCGCPGECEHHGESLDGRSSLPGHPSGRAALSR